MTIVGNSVELAVVLDRVGVDEFWAALGRGVGVQTVFLRIDFSESAVNLVCSQRGRFVAFGFAMLTF